MSDLKDRGSEDYERYKDLTYEDFRELALKRDIDKYEKIGFPSSYREGFEKDIYKDIRSKLTALRGKNRLIIDIGCGCSDLPFLLIEGCERNQSKLILIDSEEMLGLLPDGPITEKHPGRFPDCGNALEQYEGKADAIIIYSVAQHVFLEASLFDFLDKACLLLRGGGEMLVGDLPNVSKRNRFFASERGIEFHKRFTGKDELPDIRFNDLELKKLDDGVVFGIMQRYRNFGYDTYLLPQGERLPMSNRREDILIRKP
jgi:hypothetical protein